MAHIKINLNEFEDLLGRNVTDEELEEASFLGAHWNHVEGEKWDVEVYPNRPDLLSVEGLARAYRGFFGIERGLEEVNATSSGIELEVDDSVEEVRPFIGAAVVRGVDLDERTINGLIQLQEKLHETVGRKRDKLAIGLHSLEPLEPPFTYRAADPDGVSFTPLDFDSEIPLNSILEEHEKGQEYAWILENEDNYPIIVDSNGKVLSFPPIINNELTEVEEDTREIFIDVTGKHEQTVKKVLNILVMALAERGGEVETVKMDGDEMPDLEPREMTLEPDYFRSVSGVDVLGDQLVERLESMRYGARLDGGEIRVEVPAYRYDVMHQYDLIEDAVIAHRYSEVEPEMPEIDQIGGQEQLSDFTDLLRDIMVGSGAMEAHTYVLSSKEKLFDMMEREREQIVEMSNALSEGSSAVRNWLLPSLMQVLSDNKHHAYPQSFFEVADVSLLDDSSTGASNRRKLAYVVAGEEKDYTAAREVLQVLERELGVNLEVESSDEEYFEDSRSGKVLLDGEEIGVIGEFSTPVRHSWGLKNLSVSGFELDVQKLMEHS